MKDKNLNSSDLRIKAEELLKNKTSRGESSLSETDILKLLHELEVHQIELELQNEELLLAKEQAETSAEKYTELYDFAPTAYFTLTREGKIISLNLAGSQMLGKERSGLINSRFSLFVTDDTQKLFSLFIDKMFKSGARETCDVILNAEGGIPLYVHLRGAIAENNEHCHISAVDLTERKNAEDAMLEMQKQLLHAEKLESIGLLAGGIAHDFNNLLSVILGNLEYLDYVEIENPEIKDRIDKAKKCVNKLAVIIKQLMAYTGKGIYEQKELNINSLIDDNRELFRTIAGKKNQLEIEQQDNLPMVKGDKNELLKVLINLLYNAFEAVGEKDGRIKISTGVDYFDEKNLRGNQSRQKTLPGNYVFIKISDNGYGMDQETISKIFEPFFSKKFFGHGLSMPSALGVLSSHLGSILIDSEINRGSTITVLLPPLDLNASPVKIIAEKEIIKNKNPRFKGTLLIAEDEVLVLEITSDMLKLLGFDVIKANDGLEALELFRVNTDIDGIILDLTMPRLGGVETAKAIYEIDKDTRIIFASGYDISDKSLGIESVSYKAFLHKPYTMENLIETLSSVFKDLMIQI